MIFLECIGSRASLSAKASERNFRSFFYAFYAALSWDQMAHIIYYTGSVDFPSWQHHIFHSYRFGGYYAFVIILNSKPHTEFVLISFRQWLNG